MVKEKQITLQCSEHIVTITTQMFKVTAIVRSGKVNGVG